MQIFISILISCGLTFILFVFTALSETEDYFDHPLAVFFISVIFLILGHIFYTRSWIAGLLGLIPCIVPIIGLKLSDEARSHAFNHACKRIFDGDLSGDVNDDVNNSLNTWLLLIIIPIFVSALGIIIGSKYSSYTTTIFISLLGFVSMKIKNLSDKGVISNVISNIKEANNKKNMARKEEEIDRKKRNELNIMNLNNIYETIKDDIQGLHNLISVLLSAIDDGKMINCNNLNTFERKLSYLKSNIEQFSKDKITEYKYIKSEINQLNRKYLQLKKSIKNSRATENMLEYLKNIDEIFKDISESLNENEVNNDDKK